MFRKKGQSTLEYALIIVATVGALLSIQVFMKRSIQGRLRASSDQIGDHFEPTYHEHSKHEKIKSRTRFTEHHPQDAGGVMTTIETLEDSVKTSAYGHWNE